MTDLEILLEEAGEEPCLEVQELLQLQGLEVPDYYVSPY
jgi:hypothetical protein